MNNKYRYDIATAEEYLTVTQLAARIKFSPRSIYNMISSEKFVKGKHYVKPSRKKVLFLWSAIRIWMEHDDVANIDETKSIEVSRINI